ncbi:hypothetical protein QTN25_004882 [Entamoeba marina]
MPKVRSKSTFEEKEKKAKKAIYKTESDNNLRELTTALVGLTVKESDSNYFVIYERGKGKGKPKNLNESGNANRTKQHPIKMIGKRMKESEIIEKIFFSKGATQLPKQLEGKGTQPKTRYFERYVREVLRQLIEMKNPSKYLQTKKFCFPPAFSKSKKGKQLEQKLKDTYAILVSGLLKIQFSDENKEEVIIDRKSIEQYCYSILNDSNKEKEDTQQTQSNQESKEEEIMSLYASTVSNGLAEDTTDILKQEQIQHCRNTHKEEDDYSEDFDKEEDGNYNNSPQHSENLLMEEYDSYNNGFQHSGNAP